MSSTEENGRLSVKPAEAGESGRAGEGARIFSPVGFALILSAALLAFFPQVLFGAKSFFFRDFGLFGYPLAYYYRECFWQGSLPLWNPLNCCGMPYLAQWNTLTLYPLSLIYLLLPLPWSLNVFCLGHLFLAGLGMYFLARYLTRNAFAAAMAGTGFAFNGLLLNCLMWPNNIAAFGWLPWVLLATHKALRVGGRRILVAALAGAVQMLSGAPEIILFTWLTSLVFVLAEIFCEEGRRIGRVLCAGRWLLTAGLVVGLTAVQLLPFLDLLMHSSRGQNFENNTWPMPLWGWVNFILPLFGCYRSPQGVFFQTNQDWTASYYVGLPILALALVGFLWVKKPLVRACGGLSLIGLLMALGFAGGLYWLLARTVPLASFMRFPIKFVVLPVFGLPLLAGFALAHWESVGATAPVRRQFLRIGLGVLALAVVVVVFTVLCGFNAREVRPFISNSLTRLAFSAAMLACLFLLHGCWRMPRLLLMLRAGLLVLLAADLLTHAPSQNPSVPSNILVPGLVKAEVKPDSSTTCDRVLLTKPAHDLLYRSMLTNSVTDYLGRRLALFGNCNLLENIATPDGFYSLYLPQPRQAWETLFFGATNQFPTNLANFLGISRVATTSPALGWHSRSGALPFITAGQKPVFVDDRIWGQKWSDFPASTQDQVFLPASERSNITVTNCAKAKVREISVAPNALEFTVESDAPVMVVIAQAHYHWWKALCGDRYLRIIDANNGFQALEVPAGTSRIRLVYEDLAFWCGAGVSLVTLFGMIIGAIRLLRRGVPA